MRNLKKFLALVLAMLMVVSAAATVSAFEDVAEDNLFAEAIADLSVLDIVNGYDETNFGPEDAVTRQQFALMMARAITGVTDDAAWAQGGLVAFDDVTEYQYAIATVVKAGIVDGFLDNTFRPEEGVTFIQALKMAVCALGYGDGLEWWQGYYNVALDLGLTANLNQITDKDQALNRGEVAQIIYNMLYATAANGSTLYADNFEVIEEVVEPAELTTFVIVATDKQTAAAGMAVTEGGYVGIQQLVNGVPTGEVYYVANEAFGFEGAEDEDAFLAAYDFANWDNGSFDEIIPVGTSEKIYSTAVTKSSPKFTVGGVNYYPVAELTGSAIKNEVVVYNATNSGYTATNKQLFLNKAGQVLDPATGDAVLEAVYSVNGTVVSYRELGADKGSYLSIAKATELYGVVVGETVVPYSTMTVADFGTAYELTVFDDDMDGKIDRAYYTPVYAGLYTKNDSNAKATFGAMKGEKVTFSADLTDKTDYIVYTYNKQLQVVNVIEVLEPQVDVLDYVSTIKLSETTAYFTIETAEGEELIVYAGGNDAKVGADVPDVDYVDYEKLYKALQHSMGIKYTARNGVIIKAEAYNIEDTYDRVVVKEVVDLDIGTFYVEAYLDGALVEIPVTALKAGNKTIDFANISWIKQSNYLDDFVEGGVYKLVELDNGYLLSEVLVPETTTGTNAVTANYDAFKLYSVAKSTDTADLKIYDNIEDTATARADRLRTNKDTVWYFIDTQNGDVKVFAGEIEYGVIPAGAIVLADKLGYGTNDTAKKIENFGVATEVYVFDAVLKDVKGFGINTLTAAKVYIPGAVWYKYDTADKFDLDSSVYTEIGYYMYENIGVNIETGAKVTVYSDKRLGTDAMPFNKVYTVDKNGVIIDATGVTLAAAGFQTANVAKDALVLDDTFITYNDGIAGVYSYSYEITSVVSVKENASLAYKTGSDAKTAIDATTVTGIQYKVNKDNGVLVLVWTDYKKETTTELVNAKYNYNGGSYYAAIATVTGATNGVSGSVKIYNDLFDSYNQKVDIAATNVMDLDGLTADQLKIADWSINKIKADGTVDALVANKASGIAKVTVEAKDAKIADTYNFAITAINGTTPYNTLTLAKGNYQLIIDTVCGGQYVMFFTVA